MEALVVGGAVVVSTPLNSSNMLLLRGNSVITRLFVHGLKHLGQSNLRSCISPLGNPICIIFNQSNVLSPSQLDQARKRDGSGLLEGPLMDLDYDDPDKINLIASHQTCYHRLTV